MTRIAVEQLLALVHASFDGDGAHSLMANVRDLRAEDWDWLPPGAERTIREIFEHAAIAKYLYAEHMFGTAKRSYADVHGESPLRARPDDTGGLIAWAREGHAAFAAGVASLDDAGLGAPTRRHYGKMDVMDNVVGVMIRHDAYHAGEINHLRALRHRNDAWFEGLTADS